jgi:hypothetical protein
VKTPQDAIADLLATGQSKLAADAELDAARSVFMAAQTKATAATAANDAAKADAREAMVDGRLYSADPSPTPIWVRIGDAVNCVTPESVSLPVSPAGGPS